MTFFFNRRGDGPTMTSEGATAQGIPARSFVERASFFRRIGLLALARNADGPGSEQAGPFQTTWAFTAAESGDFFIFIFKKN